MVYNRFLPSIVCALFSLSGIHCLANGQGSLNANPALDFRTEMKTLVKELSGYAQSANPQFQVMVQNGVDLFHTPDPDPEFWEAVDGVAQESLFFGYHGVNTVTPTLVSAHLVRVLQEVKAAGKAVLITDYCNQPGLIEKSLVMNRELGFIPFPAPTPALDRIPAFSSAQIPFSAKDIITLRSATNFLYLINPETPRHLQRDQYLRALMETDYDLLILDAFFEQKMLSLEELTRLKRKKNGKDRLVIAYLNIGEAEDYRYYWKKSWSGKKPDWIVKENPRWKGNYKVQYWRKEWKTILYGGPSGYLDQIIAAGFDGVFLDTIDSYYFFETGEI